MGGNLRLVPGTPGDRGSHQPLVGRWLLPLFILFVLSACPEPTEAMDYEPLSFRQLLESADLVILASLEAVDNELLTARVETCLVGQASGSLQVRPHRYWPGSPRWATPEVGQHLLLFLGIETGVPGKARYRILGIGGEGEMPVEDGVLALHGTYLEGLAWTTATIHGGPLRAQRLPVDIVVDAILSWRRCAQPGIQGPCGGQELTNLRERTVLHRHLLDDRS